MFAWAKKPQKMRRIWTHSTSATTHGVYLTAKNEEKKNIQQQMQSMVTKVKSTAQTVFYFCNVKFVYFFCTQTKKKLFIKIGGRRRFDHGVTVSDRKTRVGRYELQQTVNATTAIVNLLT
jgi:hypothetical protein